MCYFNQLKFWPQQIYSFESYSVTVLPLLPPSLQSASYPLFFCFHQIFDKKEKSKNEKEKVCMSAFLEAGANTLHLNRPVGCTLCTRVFFFSLSLHTACFYLFACLFSASFIIYLFIHNQLLIPCKLISFIWHFICTKYTSWAWKMHDIHIHLAWMCCSVKWVGLSEMKVWSSEGCSAFFFFLACKLSYASAAPSWWKHK